MGARIVSCVAAVAALLCGCTPESPQSARPRRPAEPSPSFSPSPPPSFAPDGPPVTPAGFERLVVGTVAISVPRGWSACWRDVVFSTALEGPVAAFTPPGSELSPPALQVDPPPGDKLFDARNRDAWLRDAVFPNNESRIEEIAVPNAVQTAAYEFSAKGGRGRVAGFDAWAMGADETRVHLGWLSAARAWERMEPLYRDIAASIEFEVAKVPTQLESCPRASG